MTESIQNLKKQWSRIFGTPLSWDYHVIYWGIMFVLYWLNYYIWNENYPNFYDNWWLALCNVLLDGIFAYFNLLFIEVFFRGGIMSSDKIKRTSALIFWFIIIIILAMCNGMLYSIAISWLYYYDFLSPSQVGKLDWLRNVPEACFAMLTTTGFVYAARWGKNKTERETAEIRLSARKLGAHYISGRLLSLSNLVKENAWDEVRDYLSNFIKLSDYYRKAEQTGKISLETESNFIEGYIKLEKRQHRHKSEVTVIFESDIQNPNLTIFGLLFIDYIDNAFKHGFNITKKKANIYIKLSEKDGIVNLVVRNDKYTPTKEEEENMHQYGASSENKKTGIGLKNNKKRLEETYPKKYTLRNNLHDDTFYLVDLTIDLN